MLLARLYGVIGAAGAALLRDESSTVATNAAVDDLEKVMLAAKLFNLILSLRGLIGTMPFTGDKERVRISCLKMHSKELTASIRSASYRLIHSAKAASSLYIVTVDHSQSSA